MHPTRSSRDSTPHGARQCGDAIGAGLHLVGVRTDFFPQAARRYVLRQGSALSPDFQSSWHFFPTPKSAAGKVDSLAPPDVLSGLAEIPERMVEGARVGFPGGQAALHTAERGDSVRWIHMNQRMEYE